jgi:hypothetical protein
VLRFHRRRASGSVDGLRLSLLLVAALLGGCAADTADDTLQVVYDPCEPVALSPAPGAGADEVASLDRAIDMWRRMGTTGLDRAQPDAPRSGRVLEVRFETAARVFYGVYDDESGVVFINRRLSDDHARAVTIAHEVGHAFGLPHIAGRDSVMNPKNLVHEPNAGDGDSLRALWGDCGPGATD